MHMQCARLEEDVERINSKHVVSLSFVCVCGAAESLCL